MRIGESKVTIVISDVIVSCTCKFYACTSQSLALGFALIVRSWMLVGMRMFRQVSHLLRFSYMSNCGGKYKKNKFTFLSLSLANTQIHY